ncbi:hypothetical protein CNMCM7691_002768 [Aspergillus felis]|uniref:FAD-binding PCMH-type domain-containing protein n=1 Tax=Aspergillus felis TaxID=1287682 RepID=A0A8H6V775_9EURO|nr:hypothetical protein CNMCM7691_002768 [Aspergillus felis]
MSAKFFSFLCLAATAVGLANNTSVSQQSCRALPGDAAWPSARDWATLNKTIHGHLIAAIPEASVCHDTPFRVYNAQACAQLQSTWDIATITHINSPAEILNQNFQNYSCVPFTNASRPCELGNYPSYVVNVTEASDVQGALAFAQKHNIRIVIKNTGHDYLGKSTGKGSLSLWTHNLKNREYIPTYRASYYQGPAAKLGAGIEGFEAYALANSTGHRIVGGTCPTVGIVGGYTQGGGHSILSSSYGVSADNVLEWEVVTVDGRHLTATPTQNADLYWALSGGGGGTFGVVLSMTARLHPDGIVGGTLFSFNDSAVGNAAYWDAVGAFHALLPAFLDGGNSFTYSVGNTSLTAYGTMPGANATEINRLLSPFLQDLASRNINPIYEPEVSPNYYEHFFKYLGPAPYGNDAYNPFTNSRIIPRSLITNPETNAVVTDLFRNISQLEVFAPFYCDSFNVANKSHPDNSLHPAWRTGILLCAPAAAWDWHATPEEMAERDEYAAKVLQPMMDAATPGGMAVGGEEEV